jgi:DNA-binding CsgD family transcriptional regulator
MVTAGDFNFTYSDYLQKANYIKESIDKKNIEDILSNFKQLSSLSSNAPYSPIYFAIDYVKRKYLFFSNSLGNYKSEEIIEGGLDFMIPLMHPDFFKIYNEKIFPATISLLRTIPQPEHSDYIFSCNHKIINANKQCTDFYQRYTYVTSEDTGLPSICIGMAIDISHFRLDNRITLSLEKANKETGITDVMEKRIFYPVREDFLFTNQEKIILQYIAEGLTSKLIGEKLNISSKTVSSHRENMLRKTKVINVAQLISFAFNNKII